MSFAIAAVFLLCIVLLFLVFPHHRDLQRVTKPFYQLHIEHVPVHVRLGACFLASGVLIGFIAYLLLPWLSMYRLSFIPNKLYTFRPADSMAGTAGIFIGLFFGVLLSLAYGRFVLKDRWPEYIVYQSMRFKSLSPALLKYTVVLLGGLACAATLAATDHFITFTANSIEVKPTFSPFVSSYTYDQLDEIRQVETVTTFTGKIKYDPHAVLLFTDERSWNFRSEGLSPRPEEKEFIPWLLRRTGKKLVQLESE